MSSSSPPSSDSVASTAGSGDAEALRGRTVGIAAISLGNGGAERQAALWAEACAARGADVLILSLEESAQRYPLPEGAGVITVGKAGRGDTASAIRHTRKLATHCDVIAAFQPYMGVLCMLARAAPYMIVTGQDPRHWRDTTRMPSRVFHAAFARAAAATAPSEGLIECHRRLGLSPGGPWLHVPNIVDGRAYREPADQRSGVLFVGRLVPEKEPLLALRSATRAGLSITFLGDGPLRVELQAEARRLGVEELVHLEGFNPHPWDLYARHRVLLVTSRYETFANVIVEGLATGMPVVSVDCDFGPREILRGARHSHLVDAREESISEAVGAVARRAVTPEETAECMAIAGRYRRSQLEPAIVDAVRAAASR